MVVVVVAAGAVPEGLPLVAGVVVVVVQLAAQLPEEAGRVPAVGLAAALGAATHGGDEVFLVGGEGEVVGGVSNPERVRLSQMGVHCAGLLHCTIIQHVH